MLFLVKFPLRICKICHISTSCLKCDARFGLGAPDFSLKEEIFAFFYDNEDHFVDFVNF